MGTDLRCVFGVETGHAVVAAVGAGPGAHYDAVGEVSCGFRRFSYTDFGSIRTPVSGFSYTPAIGEPE